jgi:hypothetical protein
MHSDVDHTREVRAAAREHQIVRQSSLFVGTEHLQPFVEKHLQKTYNGIKQRLVLLRSNGPAQRHISKRQGRTRAARVEKRRDTPGVVRAQRRRPRRHPEWK